MGAFAAVIRFWRWLTNIESATATARQIEKEPGHRHCRVCLEHGLIPCCAAFYQAEKRMEAGA